MVNENLKKLYNELIYNVLVSEQVEKIVCNRKEGDNRFFDNLSVDREKECVIVHRYGLEMDLVGFCFDFTLDFATCLAQIEKAIFLANRRAKETAGLDITFSKEKQAYINDDNNFVFLEK